MYGHAEGLTTLIWLLMAVELRGIEPLASSMRPRRSTN